MFVVFFISTDRHYTHQEIVIKPDQSAVLIILSVYNRLNIAEQI